LCLLADLFSKKKDREISILGSKRNEKKKDYVYYKKVTFFFFFFFSLFHFTYATMSFCQTPIEAAERFEFRQTVGRGSSGKVKLASDHLTKELVK
jgi:hypothetical protein